MLSWPRKRDGHAAPIGAGKSAETKVIVRQPKKTPWYLWPFAALWRLVTGILVVTGRLIAVILGLVFVLVGALLSATIIGAIIGVPLVLFGAVLVVRGLF
jgi:hypothetical protein